MPVFTEHSASSLGEFLTITQEIYESWDKRDELPDPWFRGLSDADHVLAPSWYRLGENGEGVDEDDLLDEFERRALPLLEGPKPASVWEWYFLMQHYGLPTRLLDWSECSLVGLYFAIGDWKGRGDVKPTDAVVWMLDPWYLNKWPQDKDEVFRYDDKRVAKFLPTSLWEADDSDERPVAVMPMYNSRRLTAQRGVFTLHGTDKRPLERMLPKKAKPHFSKIIIPKASVFPMREALRLAGITDVNMFPEMSYLCQDILRAWRLLGGPIRGRE